MTNPGPNLPSRSGGDPSVGPRPTGSTPVPRALAPPPSFTGFREPEEGVIGRYRGILILLGLAALAVVGAIALVYIHYQMGQQPHRVVKMVIGAAVGAVILMRPAWALGLLPLSFVYLVWLPKSPIPMVNGMNLLVFSIFLGWAGQSIAQRRALMDRSPWTTPLALFLAWYGFAWARTVVMTGGGLGYFMTFLQDLWAALCGLLLFYPVYNSIRTWRQVRIFSILFCAGSGLGVIGIAWEAAHGGWQAGVGGGVGQVNIAAAYFATVTLFGVGLLGARLKGTGRRFVLVSSVIASGASLLIPASRGAYLGFLLGALPQVFRAGIIWVLVLALSVGAFLLWAPDYARERVTRAEDATKDDAQALGAEPGSDAILQGQLNDEAGGRIEFWNAGLKIIARNPIIGVGYGQLPLEIEKEIGRVKPVHNLYLETAGESGIPGLVLLLWLFFAGLAGSAVLLRVPGFPRALGLGYQSAILALMVANMFGGRLYVFNMSGMVAFLTALVFRARALVREGISEADEEAVHLNGAAPSATMAGGR